MNGWVRQFAIMMPNGELYWRAVKGEPVTDYSQSSVLNDMYGILGAYGAYTAPETDTPVVGRETIVFANRADAEKQLAEIRKQAELFGVALWGGTVVERLCTPFVATDPATQFMNDVITWIQQQTRDA